MTEVVEERVTLDVALREYEAWRVQDGGYSTKTWAGEKPGLLGFVDFMAERKVTHPGAITAASVSKWWGYAQTAWEPSTCATRLHQLRSFLGYCVKVGYLAEDPSGLIRAPRPAPEPRDRLDAFELLQLVEGALWPRDRILLALAANLALRGGEIQRLTWGDVYLNRGEIVVRVDKTHEVDVMAIGPDLEQELRIWREHVRAVAVVEDANPLVCAHHVDGTRMQAHLRPLKQVAEPYLYVQSALARLGWETTKQEGVHTIRRSVARIYFDDVEGDESFDSALLATMTLLHHSRPETTLKYIGRDRHKLARDRHMSRPFLTRLAGACAPITQLRSVQ